MTRRTFALSPAAFSLQAQAPKITKIVRYDRGGTISHGVLSNDGKSIAPIAGSIFQEPYRSPRIYVPVESVKLLYPIVPPKTLAVGRNYKSHAGANVPSRPEIFYKPGTSLQNPGDPIVIPPDAKNVHFEGELVVVIGKRLSRASVEEAREGIFGVTCGNDVSERDWQGGPDKDMQWWRAKGADTFGPMGPAIVRGLDYSNLMLTTRVNGEVKQQQSTKDLIFDCPTIVSFVSKYVALEQGDVVFTGTPGTTSAMKPGDVCEIEIEGVGVLKNPVKSA
jgi:2-keto-4-pentenoate hydratase/2-oxohepta-3-ene-1,7-dioic acid hydratase in catechol pathway